MDARDREIQKQADWIARFVVHLGTLRGDNLVMLNEGREAYAQFGGLNPQAAAERWFRSGRSSGKPDFLRSDE